MTHFPRLAAVVFAIVLPCSANAAFVLEEATVASVHKAFADKSLTCRQLVDAYLKRVAAYDKKGPKINAVITVNAKALATAGALDAAYRADPTKAGPLHCIPILLKDNNNTADMRTTGGSVNLKTAQPTKDAFTVAKLRAAGAVVIAKVNLSELALSGMSVSSLGGQTLNPYDLTRSPGGSSGGTGAGVAANFAVFGTGSDTGQSIRSPSSANSLVGLRSTRGLISRSGILPISQTQDEAGPLARTVSDLAIAMDVMAGYDPEDPITAMGLGHVPKTYTAFLKTDALKGKRIGMLRPYFGAEAIHAEVNAVMDKDITALKALGATVVDIVIPDLDALTADMGTSPFELKTVFNTYLKTLGPTPPVKDFADFVAKGGFHPVMTATVKTAAAKPNGMGEPAYTAIFARRDVLRKAVLFAMAENKLDVIAYPHQKRLVVPVGDEQVERNGVLSNATGFPAITLPGGFSAPTKTAPIGVPVGIELLGREWSEGDLIAMGYAFEQGTHFRKPPASAPALK